mmetsp:Transcript_18529/g.20137  ORF Transcript_18529/g.20137 Transcript_18529/m.20137 type:complete len:108 (+) Transcript_18529:1319-1642(+)
MKLTEMLGEDRNAAHLRGLKASISSQHHSRRSHNPRNTCRLSFDHILSMQHVYQLLQSVKFSDKERKFKQSIIRMNLSYPSQVLEYHFRIVTGCSKSIGLTSNKDSS